MQRSRRNARTHAHAQIIIQNPSAPCAQRERERSENGIIPSTDAPAAACSHPWKCNKKPNAHTHNIHSGFWSLGADALCACATEAEVHNNDDTHTLASIGPDLIWCNDSSASEQAGVKKLKNRQKPILHAWRFTSRGQFVRSCVGMWMTLDETASGKNYRKHDFIFFTLSEIWIFASGEQNVIFFQISCYYEAIVVSRMIFQQWIFHQLGKSGSFEKVFVLLPKIEIRPPLRTIGVNWNGLGIRGQFRIAFVCIRISGVGCRSNIQFARGPKFD